MELKPCPFCGSDVNGQDHTATCYFKRPNDGVDVANPRWNTRPIEDAKDKRIAELEALLSNIEIEIRERAVVRGMLAKPEQITKNEPNNLRKITSGGVKQDYLECTICGTVLYINDMYSCDACSERCQETIKKIQELDKFVEAFGLLTTLSPKMEIDINHPLEMAQRIEWGVVVGGQRIVELEAQNLQLCKFETFGTRFDGVVNDLLKAESEQDKEVE